MGGAFSYLVNYKGKKILIQQATRYNQELKSTLSNHKIDIIFQGIANRRSTNDLYENIWKIVEAKTIIPLHHDNFFFEVEDYSKIDYLYGISFSEFQAFFSSKTNIKKIEPLYFQKLSL